MIVCILETYDAQEGETHYRPQGQRNRQMTSKLNTLLLAAITFILVIILVALAVVFVTMVSNDLNDWPTVLSSPTSTPSARERMLQANGSIPFSADSFTEADWTSKYLCEANAYENKLTCLFTNGTVVITDDTITIIRY